MEFRKISLYEIASLMELKFKGENIIINGLNFCNSKSQFGSIISYSTNINFLKSALENKVIRSMFVHEDDYSQLSSIEQKSKVFFIVDYPETSFYKLHEILTENNDFYIDKSLKSQICETAIIHKSAILEENVQIGSNTIIGPNAIIRKNTVIENNVKIGANSEIGSEGFQVIYNQKNEPYLVKHVGGVKIEDNVSIGSNSTVCNSLFEGYTKIGRNTKIDCHVHISHNCEVGSNTVIVDGTILLGSAKINNNVWVGPNAVIMNKIIIDNNSFVGSSSLVGKNVDPNTKVFGIPARRIE